MRRHFERFCNTWKRLEAIQTPGKNYLEVIGKQSNRSVGTLSHRCFLLLCFLFRPLDVFVAAHGHVELFRYRVVGTLPSTCSPRGTSGRSRLPCSLSSARSWIEPSRENLLSPSEIHPTTNQICLIYSPAYHISSLSCSRFSFHSRSFPSRSP